MDLHHDLVIRELHRDDPSEVERVAALHESIPGAWDPRFRLDPARVAAAARELSAWTPLTLVLVAEPAFRRGLVVALHWIDLEFEAGRLVGQVRSLWVDEALRGRGIARRLKERGEGWARRAGAGWMRTQVHGRNARMLEINLRAGYEPGYVPMRKRL